jgi:hypothetical protein
MSRSTSAGMLSPPTCRMSWRSGPGGAASAARSSPRTSAVVKLARPNQPGRPGHPPQRCRSTAYRSTGVASRTYFSPPTVAPGTPASGAARSAASHTASPPPGSSGVTCRMTRNRIGGRAARRPRSDASGVLPEPTMFWVEVRPNRTAAPAYAVTAAACAESDRAGGNRRALRRTAYSHTAPVTRPAASRSYQPPAGSRTSSGMASARSATPLSSNPCPGPPYRRTGCPGAARSSAARRRRVSASAVGPIAPVSHVPGGVRRAAAASESRTSAGAGSPNGGSPSAIQTPPGSARTCTCASLKPGTTTRPPSATRRVAGPASAVISAVVPTATTRSPRTATARPTGACCRP